MQPSDVTAYGCDYSAREFTPSEMGLYPGVRIDWLARYIGYRANRKCISHYPGAYRRHRDAGRPVVLYHQVEYRDFEGGYDKGRGHAQVALADARAEGWNGETPILACFDRRMPAFVRNGISYRAIWLDEVRSYMQGFVSVLGYEDSGFYGFEDTMKPCVDENWVRFRMQCGARSAHIRGISAWQENNEQPLLLGTQTDRLELYIPLSDIGGAMATAKEIVDELLGRWLEDKREGVPDSERHPTQVSNALWSTWHTIHFGDPVNGAYPSTADLRREIKEIGLTVTDQQLDKLAEKINGLNQKALQAAMQSMEGKLAFQPKASQ